MREQLIQYVELLFAGAPNSEDIKLEILQNTLDRFDDLVSQGKTPEAAYRLAISGIGDINEILGSKPQPEASNPSPTPAANPDSNQDQNDGSAKKMRAIAVALYICCVIPVITLGKLGDGVLGICMMFLMIAAATAIMIMTGKEEAKEQPKESPEEPRQALKNSITKTIGTVGLAVYLIISFITGAWHITWLIFPILGCVKGLVSAIFDLKEANNYEN